MRALFNTNVFGLMEVTTAFAPLLHASVSLGFSPIIVKVASVLARVPNAFASAYNASKAAVSAYSDTVRLELHPLGLKFKTLYMGEVSTPLMAADNIDFGPESIYHVLEDSVKARTDTHLAKTMAPAQFAGKLQTKFSLERVPPFERYQCLCGLVFERCGTKECIRQYRVEGGSARQEEARSIIFKLGQAKAKKDAPGNGQSSQI